MPVSSSHVERIERGDPLLPKPTKNPKPNKNENHDIERRDPYYSDIPEGLQEFTEKLVDDRVPEHGAVLLMNYLWSLREVRIWVSTVFILTSLKTDIARSVRGPKLQGPRAEDALAEPENFGDLITADHKVLSDNCESRNNHRYAVVVQNLATQWIQSYLCKTKTSQETQRSLQKFLEPERKPKVIYTDKSLEFGKSCEDLSWNHCTSTPHRSETNGIAERAVRRVTVAIRSGQ